MYSFLEILKYVLPSLVVFATSYYLLKIFLDNNSKTREIERQYEHKQKRIELQLKNKELTTPIRLQAYERIVLLLERISPNSLIMRVHYPGMNAFQLQTELIKNIREEFEHNLSQQVYMSSQAWDLVRDAKEKTIKLINTASLKLDEKATGIDLSQQIFELSATEIKLPTSEAIEFVKNEIRENF